MDHHSSSFLNPKTIAELCYTVVDWSHRHARSIVLVIVTLSTILFFIGIKTLQINVSQSYLFLPDEPWRVLEDEFYEAFPQFNNLLILVVEGTTAEVSERAVKRLTDELLMLEDLFETVQVIESEPFFHHQALLFLPLEELTRIITHLIEAQPFLGILSVDPSLRGLFQLLSLSLEGHEGDNIHLNQFIEPINEIAKVLHAALTNEYYPFSWQRLLTGYEPDLHGLRRLIFVTLKRDFGQLTPSEQALSQIRTIISELDFPTAHGVRIRLTGNAAIENEELATIVESIWISIVLSVTLIIILLTLGLRSWRLIVSALVTLAIGLMLTTVFAAFVVGSLNPLSVAFSVLFIGIGIDFGIQFTTCYRTLRHQHNDLAWALRTTGYDIGPSLLLAAIILSIGFFSFTPTSYLGVVQLGLIAGVGMLISVILNLTLLPALISLFNPTSEPDPIRYQQLAPVDQLLLKRRRTILLLTGLLTIVAMVYATHIRFDFNSLNLRSIRSESLSTILELIDAPEVTPLHINILTESQDKARELTRRLESLSTVDTIFSIDTMIPSNQEQKLAIIQDAQLLLLPSLYLEQLPAPTVVEIRAAITQTLTHLQRYTDQPEFVYFATQLQHLLDQEDDTAIHLLMDTLGIGLSQQLNTLRDILSPEYITFEMIPQSIRHDWISPEGKVRLFIAPAGNPRENETLIRFADEVRSIAPHATGPVVTMQDAAETILHAFLTAGIIALCLITSILYLIFRRLIDVILVLMPLVISSAFTLATCVLIDLPFNFANIIALPLQIGISVAFNIYFIICWRSGFSGLLQSSIARAMLFSTLTTLAAFSSLALSSHPGTASMGILLFISLTYTLFTTLFILPAMMGPAKSEHS